MIAAYLLCGFLVYVFSLWKKRNDDEILELIAQGSDDLNVSTKVFLVAAMFLSVLLWPALLIVSNFFPDEEAK